jgi:ATP-dependent exoDNAse (exonuclease V) alpha subunit
LRALLPRAKIKVKGKGNPVAIFHLSVKTISRSAGRSATAAAAYRSGVEIADQRTGEVHDYTRKRGIAHTELVLPAGAPEWAADRAAVWNAAEQAETRKNSTVAREFEIALPAELSPAERQRVAVDFAREIVTRHGCIADVSIHEPGREGDNRNHHAHILCSTRRLTPEGFGEKTRELDDRKTGEVDRWRERFATIQNERFQVAGIEARVDHRSLEEQGIDRAPTQHLGPTATAIERRTGQPSRKRQDFEQQAADRLAAAREAGERERESQAALDRTILDLSGDLSAAIARRDQLVTQQQAAQEQQRAAAIQAQLAGGRADFRAKYEAHKAEKEKQRLAELGRAEIERQKAAAVEQQRQQAERERAAKQQQDQERNGPKPKGPGFSR